MKRRDVLTTTAALAFAGCLDGGDSGGGGSTDDGPGPTHKSPEGSTETQTSATSVPTATDAGTSVPQTVQKTEPGTETKTAVQPADTVTETATGTTDTPIPIPDRLTDTRKGTPLTGEARVAFEDGGSRIIVTGTIVGENGCQKPVLDSVRETKSGLVITVATERDAPANAACTMALVELEYRFPVTVETPPKSVTVIHRGVTGKRTITTAKPGG